MASTGCGVPLGRSKSKDGHRAKHRVLLARDDDVPVQQVRRPVGLAPRPRDEADGVVLAPAAPFLAEAALGDAGHFFSRSSRWLAAVFAALLVVRVASGELGLSATSAAVVATVPVAVAGHTRAPAVPLAKLSSRSTGRSDGTSLRLARTSTGRRGRFFGRQAWTIPAQYVLAPVSGLLCLELGADFGESVTARPALIRRRPECARRRQR